MNIILPPAELEPSPASPQPGKEAPEIELAKEPGSEIEADANLEDDPDEDIEWEGGKYRVPKTVAPQLRDRLGQFSKHFTNNNQAHSARLKELDAREQRITEAAKVSEEELTVRARLHHVNSELARFKDFGWAEYQQLRNEDPAKAEEVVAYRNMLQTEQAELDKNLSTAETKRTQEAQTAMSQRFEAAEQYAATKLKGWNTKSAQELVDFVVKTGGENHQLPEPDVKRMLASNMAPLTLELMYLARIGSEVLKRQAAPKPKPAPEPLEQVSPKAANQSAKPSDKDDIDTWMRKRQAQREKQQRRG